ncbi:MAG: sortase [Eubacteriales bacterium]|nr:sortase [Eubacteriales bacterium]
MRNKAGIVCMVLGTALILAALFLFSRNQQEDRQAGERAEYIMEEMLEEIAEEMTEKMAEETRQRGTEDETSVTDPYDSAMPEVIIDGYAYIGYLSIPAIGVELPVMSEWDYTRLKTAPCRYAGSPKAGNFVIAAHNYARHFGSLSCLSEGDQVFFTGMDGTVWDYAVDAVEVLAPAAVEDMTESGYDLTLFTCTYGGASRVTVRCDRVRE